ncbi:DUF5689 domain-containing protein [Chryseobacterium mucoviscidosis]|uniref:DUF5689 domain-containing protein n=1 Tax=Chryseobacterium mucoviscidosis TaxID=1945581 RepID=A0A202C338_9FLAO|nr:DUF5689 domain-containing protein [Chryseobacterium mucoviscidosis]OVE58199.1 hypothetical protein B0E34_08465 [Chryseobacterium mucoviscidosis]
MNIKNFLKISLGVAVLGATQLSCIHDDKWDAPEITCNNKFAAPTMTMADFVALSPSSGVYTVPAQDATHPEVIFDGYVVSSDANGNFYKTLVFQDKPQNPTVGLVLGINKSLNYADFPVGAHIRIRANGMVIGKSAGVITLGVKDPDFAIGRIPESIISRYIAGVCNGTGLDIATITPRELTLADIKNDKYINTLAKVKNVQFVDAEVGLNLMNTDASGTAVDTDRHIIDIYGTQATVRTDGFFKPTYAIPNTSGDITFVVSKYNSSFQNVIRGISDIEFKNPRLTPATLVLNEPFANLTANAWTAFNVSGTQVWGTTNFGNPAPSAYISGLGGVNEDWLISKSLSLSGATAAKLYFETDVRFPGNPLQVLITTDTYAGGNPNTLNWTPLNAVIDTDIASFGGFVGSGLIDLTPYLNQNIRIAFKYTNPSTTVASAVEIDNVKVFKTP